MRCASEVPSAGAFLWRGFKKKRQSASSLFLKGAPRGPMERGIPFLHFRHSFDFRQEVMCQWAGDGRQTADAGGRNGTKKDYATILNTPSVKIHAQN